MMRTLSSLALVVAAGIAAAVVACSSSSGGSGAGVDAASSGGGKCGDGVCAVTELHNCIMDCGMPITSCGDGTCDPTKSETTVSCPQDCGTAVVCGDGTCDVPGGETSQNCPQDCGGGGGSGSNPPLDCRDSGVQQGCGLCLLTGICLPPANEGSCSDCSMRSTQGVDCDGGAFDGTCADDENISDCFFDCFLG